MNPQETKNRFRIECDLLSKRTCLLASVAFEQRPGKVCGLMTASDVFAKLYRKEEKSLLCLFKM